MLDSRFVSFSTQQVKADEQHASDQTPENTSAVVATTTSSEAQNTVAKEWELRKVFRQKIPLQQRPTPATPTLSNNQSSDKGTKDKVASEKPAPTVVVSRTIWRTHEW